MPTIEERRELFDRALHAEPETGHIDREQLELRRALGVA